MQVIDFSNLSWDEVDRRFAECSSLDDLAQYADRDPRDDDPGYREWADKLDAEDIEHQDSLPQEPF